MALQVNVRRIKKRAEYTHLLLISAFGDYSERHCILPADFKGLSLFVTFIGLLLAEIGRNHSSIPQRKGSLLVDFPRLR